MTATSQAADPAAPPLRKPLYLDGAQLRRLALEGPALRVEDRRGRRRYYPLTRLSRVLLRGTLVCDTAALTALLAAGLPFGLLDTDGRALGWLVPTAPAPDSGLARLIEDAENLGLLARALEDWRRSRQRMLILRHVAPALGPLHPTDLRARSIRSRAAGRLWHRSGRDWRRLLRRFRPLLRALAFTPLREAGTGSLWLGGDSERPDLAGIFAVLLEWPLLGAALRDADGPRLAAWRDEIAFFERLRAPLEREIARLLPDLRRHLHDTLFHLGSQP